ncbi:MAG: type II secretion system protein GspJ [Candidatus Omnitrophica bacterium]|nr:type II secretion system protein GspJ [Candidatus Omnitrophota bacterium]
MNSLRNKSGLTFVEVILAAALTTMVGVTIYQSLAMGIGVWQRSQQLNLEEDVVIFLDKLSYDLYNSFLFSQIKFEGNEFRIAFPTMVYTPADRRLNLGADVYVEQIGKVEYYYDLGEDKVYRRQANYSQALRERYTDPQELVAGVDNLRFRFYFLTESDELSSSEILDVLPTGVEITVEFSDAKGKRTMRKFIDIPVGS